jgi:hypothetical protein
VVAKLADELRGTEDLDVTRGGRHQQSGGFVSSFGEEWRRRGCRSGAGHAESPGRPGSR